MSVDPNFVEFSKPFIDAAKNVFETMVYTKLEPQKPLVKVDNIAKGDVTAVIGLSGALERAGSTKSFKGMLAISFPFETYFKVAGAMLMETYTEYGPEIEDVAGELANMIMGNAKRDLKVLGYSSNMAIPTIISGKNHSIKYPTSTVVVLITVKCSHGDFYMELCYQEA